VRSIYPGFSFYFYYKRLKKKIQSLVFRSGDRQGKYQMDFLAISKAISKAFRSPETVDLAVSSWLLGEIQVT